MRRKVAFITSVFPSFQGNGLAMRAAANLSLLSKWADVHLVVLPIYTAGTESPAPEIERLCSSWCAVANPDWSIREEPTNEIADILGNEALPREWQWCNSQWQAKLKKTLQEINPDLVIVFRFYLVPYVLPAIEKTTPLWLDIDELESNSRERLAHILSMAGKTKAASAYQSEVPAYEKLERHFLNSFQRIFASSEKEAQGVIERNSKSYVKVLPNTYPHSSPQPLREPDGTIRFLFVGSLGYYPNQDAVEFFSREILPLIESKSKIPVKVTIIGSGWRKNNESAAEIENRPQLNFVGAVPDTTPYYAATDAVIVPLRSAGGTRIKILEAFSHKRPVISTTIGAEGLKCLDGVHLDLADTPENFAAHCLRLMEDSQRRKRLSENGHALFVETYAMPALDRQLEYFFEG